MLSGVIFDSLRGLLRDIARAVERDGTNCVVMKRVGGVFPNCLGFAGTLEGIGWRVVGKHGS